MGLMEKLEDAKATLEQAKRNRNFKKANAKREAAAELLYTLGQCRGKLEVSQSEFRRTIQVQSRNIQQGRKNHQDTLIQEQILWDAAIGYMLVKDAIYALKSVTSYDSVAHAYDLLDAAMRQIAGKKNGLGDFLRIKSKKDRNEYGYITSDAAVKDKEALLESFFEELKVTGDIDACMEKATYPETRQVERAKGAAERTGGNAFADALNDLPDDEEDMDSLDEATLDRIMDINPPME